MSWVGIDTFMLGGDREVRRLGFGALRVTGAGCSGPPRDPAAAKRLLRRAVELGVNLIDTADSYGPEVSEMLIAEALHPYPADLVIATKGGLLPGPDGRPRDARPQQLRSCCEASLRRLKLERIDLYQLHSPDPEVPLEESVGALSRLQEEGKIHHVGLSNVSAAELTRARRVATVACVQNRYSLGDRKSERVLAACERDRLGFIPWFPLREGRLTRRGGVLGVVARRHGATPAQVALAWLLAHSHVMLPIPGTSSVAHLEENVAAGALELGGDELRWLEAVA
ncbi:MAG: aldo/keto reductase [Egibacteraceae bacterium]